MRRPWLLLLLLVGCTAEMVDSGDPAEDFDFDTGGDGKSDGVTFDQNNVISDELFTGAAAMDVADVQAFFEASPYHNRSWLADYSLDGVSAAEMIVDAATIEQIHPLVLIARMQVETSMVSKTVKPSERTINRALGCGCSDGASCTGWVGFTAQLGCGAGTCQRV